MLKQFIFNASYFLLLLASVSCASGQQHKSQEFENAKVYASVKCISDTNVSYALFLPPQYQAEKPCLLLILFDPHGDGLLPVTLFSADAAKSSFIIAGSNNSKNGMTTDQTTAIYQKMIADIESRFNIEKKAIYLCGFSGGSRVSGAIAITEGGIAGVVGCGAGLPNINQSPVNPFSYLAIAGKQDFNYTEMVNLDKSLEQAGYQHYLLVFDGIHQWPPKEIIPEIFTWLRFDAMRQHVIPPDNTEINLFIDKNDKVATDFSVQGKPAREQEIYIKMLHYLQGLKDTAPIEAEINRLSGEKQVIEYHNQQEEFFKIERELQQQYAPQLELKSAGWWTTESSRLISLSNKTVNPGMSQVYKRLLGFLSLNSYMLSTNALKQGNLTDAERYIEIYGLIDPSNAEHCYLAAKVAALQHNTDAVFKNLNQAYALGFKDSNRMKSDPDFKAYTQDERFKSLAATH
jgi:hypothetical protein